jgi:pyridinium-3,5-bisthiocarboxylic acid mononucleotide nickel chelatase
VPLTCYLDAFSGISGDMLVGALADAGADQDSIARAIHSLPSGASVSFEKVKRGGIAATKFRVSVEPATGADEHSHRHLSHILDLIARASLSGRARYNAQAIFRKLGEAEAEVHQVPLEEVHFHEVGAADSIADIVGACVAFDLLGVDSVICSPINVGSGTIQTEHGMLPVPAPATARLLKEVPVYSLGPAVELATPTGAAVVATVASQFGALPPMKISKIGYGAGDRDFPEQANVLRVLLGEPTEAQEAVAVSVLEANIDDANSQVLAYAAERLMDAGALDVTLQPAIMKKGRLGSLLRVIARPQDRETLAQLIFSETTTLGLRIYQSERRVEARSFTDIETPHGTVRMKVSGNGAFAPEYEDCRKLALETGVPLKEILAAANHAYLTQKT